MPAFRPEANSLRLVNHIKILSCINALQKGMAMTGKQLGWKVSFGILMGACLCFGQTDSASDSAQNSSQAPSAAPVLSLAGSEFKNAQSLWFALDEGQVVQGEATQPINHVWQQDMLFHFTEDMSYMERLRLILSIECQMTFSYQPEEAFPQTLAPNFHFYPNDAEISYSFGNLDRPWLRMSAGYFPYKYNPDAKDLGEYLFRDAAYPTFIITNFEFAQTRELGFHLNGCAGVPAIDEVMWDLMLTSETHYWPLQDWTVSAVVSNNLFNFFDLGLGASWQRLISVNEAITTPTNPASAYVNSDGDSSHYTFRGLKLMGRASISPMRFIPNFKIPFAPVFGDKPFFGKEDLKIYGELGVLGLFNYTKYDSEMVDTAGGQAGHKALVKAPEATQVYDSLADRMPYMIGINLPTNPLLSYGILPFILAKWLRDETGSDIRPLAWITLIPALASGVCDHYLGWDLGLDVLSLEFEWASSRFPDDNSNAIIQTHGTTPTPYAASLVAQRVKYALYFKKSFGNQRFALSGLVGRDHMRPPEDASPDDMINHDFLETKAQWWWTLRLSANF
jgi:hypothetical protein